MLFAEAAAAACADLKDASLYLAKAKEQINADPSSAFAQSYTKKISDLDARIKDPSGSTWLASQAVDLFGHGAIRQKLIQQLVQGGYNFSTYLGAEERIDLLDAATAIIYSGGSYKLGDETIDNLVTFAAGGDMSLGEQSSLSGGFNIMRREGRAGFSAGAFAGAQSSGMASLSVDGVGARVFGQLWEGIGAKANSCQLICVSFD